MIVNLMHPGKYDTYHLDYPHEATQAELDAAYAEHWDRIAELGNGGGYDWDIIEVWRRKSDGKIVYEQDAGCSCYGPWESSSLDTLIDLDDYRAFRDYVHGWNGGYDGCSATAVADFLDSVRRAMAPDPDIARPGS